MGEPNGVSRIRRIAIRAHLLWLVVVAGTVALTLVHVAQVTKARPGDCDGIGFGCSLHGADAVVFAALYVVPIALVVLALGHTIIALIAHRAAVRARSLGPSDRSGRSVRANFSKRG